MPGLWIDDSIMALKRPHTQKNLLARICYRAGIARDGCCWDSNTELGKALGIHPQMISTLVQKLEQAKLIQATVHEKLRNRRSIAPLAQLLKPYRDNAERYKQLMDVDYQQIVYSQPLELSTNRLDPINDLLVPYQQNADSTINDSLIDYQRNADSYYKDRKLLENSSIKVDLQNVVVENAHTTTETFPQNLPAEEKPPTPTPPPKKKYGDGQLQEEVRQLFLAHRQQHGIDPYPPEMIPEFLDYYTAIVQNSEKTSDNGKELYRTYLTWNTTKKLEKWHNTKLDDERKQQQAARAGKTTAATSTARGSSGTTGASKRPVKRTPIITADQLCRDSETSRHTDSGGIQRTISLDVDGSH